MREKINQGKAQDASNIKHIESISLVISCPFCAIYALIEAHLIEVP